VVILPQGDIFASGPAVSGSKTNAAHLWKYCAYSTQSTNYNQDARVPSGQKTYHSETNGRMHTYSLGAGIGWICADNDCSYYKGTATTEVPQAGRRFVTTGCVRTTQDFATLSGSVDHSTQGRTIVSGTRYYEI
jgi:hypothetical protein